MTTRNTTILMIGCFDTKGEDFMFLRECLLGYGHNIIAVNTGVMETPRYFPVDVDADAVATEGGSSLHDLRKDSDRGRAVDVMGAGAARIVEKLLSTHKVHAAIGMGGGGGTYIALTAMQAIPLGIPKLCVSTLATKDVSRQVGHKDIVLMPSIVDVAGINSISRRVIRQAAAAISGMSAVEDIVDPDAPLRIAISMFGNTSACVNQCSDILRKKGYEVYAFHANGVGGRSMEALIREHCFDAILDVTTTELADDLCGGICSAGPERLTAAAELGLPQVIVPGCLDMVNFAQPDTVPAQYRNRELYSWAPDVTLLRTDTDENIELGKRLAEKTNRSSAPVSVLLPLRGISQIDSEGGIFYRPEYDNALFSSIREHLDPAIPCNDVDAHINDRKFAERLVEELLKVMELNKTKIQKTYA